MIDYITVKETALNWKISERRVQILCLEGRIDGAVKMANAWFIPNTALKPIDKRIRNKGE